MHLTNKNLMLSIDLNFFPMWRVICNNAKISSRDLNSNDSLPRKLKKVSVLSKWSVTCMFRTMFFLHSKHFFSQMQLWNVIYANRHQINIDFSLEFFYLEIEFWFNCCKIIHNLTNGERFANKSCSFTWNHVQNWIQVKSAILFGTFRPYDS